MIEYEAIWSRPIAFFTAFQKQLGLKLES